MTVVELRKGVQKIGDDHPVELVRVFWFDDAAKLHEGLVPSKALEIVPSRTVREMSRWGQPYQPEKFNITSVVNNVSIPPGVDFTR